MKQKQTVGIVIGAVVLSMATWSWAAEPSCEELRAKLDVYAQVLLHSRSQAEQQVAALAVEVERLKQANADLQKQVDDAKTHGARKEQP